MITRNGLRWKPAAKSVTGHVRRTNEDRMGWRRAPFGDVYVVSDGMGGYRGGALAAQLTVDALLEELVQFKPERADAAEQMRSALLKANAVVHKRRQTNDPDTKDMGATAVAMVTFGPRVMIGHVGDSRAYLLRSGRLSRLTVDHTRVQKLFEQGLIRASQLDSHPEASVLDRAIGYSSDVEASVSTWSSLERGDQLLLCSDGLCGYVSDAEIASTLNGGRKEPEQLVNELVEVALSKGGEDNITVQLVRFDGSEQLARLRVAGWCLGLGLAATAAGVAGMSLTTLFRPQELPGSTGEAERIDKDISATAASAPVVFSPPTNDRAASATAATSTESGASAKREDPRAPKGSPATDLQTVPAAPPSARAVSQLRTNTAKTTQQNPAQAARAQAKQSAPGNAPVAKPPASPGAAAGSVKPKGSFENANSAGRSSPSPAEAKPAAAEAMEPSDSASAVAAPPKPVATGGTNASPVKPAGRTGSTSDSKS